GLHPVHVDVWLGFIFVCFAGERPISMADYLGDLDFAGFDPHGLKLAAIKTIDVNANWKIVVENNQECYHCSLNHHDLLTSVDWRILGTDDFDGYVTKRANGLEVAEREYDDAAFTIDNRSVCARPLPRPDAASCVSWGIHWEPAGASF